MNTEWQLPHGIDSVHEFTSDASNRYKKSSHDGRMELSKTLCHGWSINQRQKQSNSRSWNRQWILSDSYCMESTALMNSRPTYQINSKNRVLADAWNSKNCCHGWSINRRPKQSNSRPWNRPWMLSDRYCMKSTTSMNSWSTHPITCKNIVMADAWHCQKRYVTADP
jgi:hypothetical protein